MEIPWLCYRYFVFFARLDQTESLSNRKRHLRSRFALFQYISLLFRLVQCVKIWAKFPGVAF